MSTSELTDQQKKVIRPHIREDEPIRTLWADNEQIILVADRYLTHIIMQEDEHNDDVQTFLLKDAHVNGAIIETVYESSRITKPLAVSGAILIALGGSIINIYNRGIAEISNEILIGFGISVIGVIALSMVYATYNRKRQLRLKTDGGAEDYTLELTGDIDDSVLNAIFNAVETADDNKVE